MTKQLPNKEPTLRVVPFPGDTNAYGDIFGGWLLSQMDLAVASEATSLANCRVVTVGIESMNFHQPVFVGDEVSFYTEIVRTGRTSIAVHIQSWRGQEPKALKIPAWLQKVSLPLLRLMKIESLLRLNLLSVHL